MLSLVLYQAEEVRRFLAIGAAFILVEAKDLLISTAI